MDNYEKGFHVLIGEGVTVAGAIGVLANLKAESNMKPNIVERLCLNRYRENGIIWTDETYTAAVDSGKISKKEFLNPMGKKYGYGLVQWTIPSRKEGLYNMCKAAGVSISDLETQLKFMVKELRAYRKVWKVITTTNSYDEATRKVMTDFESPADQSEAKQRQRVAYAENLWNSIAVPYLKVSEKKYTVGWHEDETGWWYANSETTYYANQWVTINHHRYYFNQDGYAVTGWLKLDGKWYFFENTVDDNLECALYVSDSNGAQKPGYFN